MITGLFKIHDGQFKVHDDLFKIHEENKLMSKIVNKFAPKNCSIEAVLFRGDGISELTDKDGRDETGQIIKWISDQGPDAHWKPEFRGVREHIEIRTGEHVVFAYPGDYIYKTDSGFMACPWVFFNEKYGEVCE